MIEHIDKNKDSLVIDTIPFIILSKKSKKALTRISAA